MYYLRKNKGHPCEVMLKIVFSKEASFALNDINFFLWGYVLQRSNNIDELKEILRHEISLITPESLHNFNNMQEFEHRLAYCQEVNDRDFDTSYYILIV